MTVQSKGAYFLVVRPRHRTPYRTASGWSKKEVKAQLHPSAAAAEAECVRLRRENTSNYKRDAIERPR